jgi:hypothetical protein
MACQLHVGRQVLEGELASKVGVEPITSPEFLKEQTMRGWIILHSVTATIGIASAASGSPTPGFALGLSAIGVVLLALAIGAQLVRGRP